MASRTRRTMTATASDGTEVTEQTAGSYDTAGLIQHEDGSWVIVAHGWSRSSVYNRTNTLYNRGSYKAMCVSDLIELTAPVIREYFGTHQVLIEGAYSTGTHKDVTENDLRTVLYAAGASLDIMRGVVQVAKEHPGAKGDAGIQLASGIASITFNGGDSFTIEWLAAGWHSAGIQHVRATRSFLKSLARCGFTAVAIRRGDRVADFQVGEILKSMNTRSR